MKTSSIIFKTDPVTKKRAMKRAKEEGATISAFLNFAMRSFADGDISMGISETPNRKTALELARREKTAHKNSSPVLSGLAEVSAYLKKNTL